MARVAWTLVIREEKIEEYERAHAAVWPTVLKAIKDAGVRNYSIHRHGTRLFGYFECDDPEVTLPAMKAGQAAAGWGDAMQDVVTPEVAAHGVDYMPEIFRLD